MGHGLTIAALAEKLSTGTVLLNGVEVKVRALAAGETDRLARLYPEAAPPLVKDPAAGSGAPGVENRNDPAWQAEHGRWFKLMLTLQVAAAAGLAVKDGGVWDAALDDEKLRAWCEAALKELSAACSAADLWSAWRAVRDLGDSSRSARDELVVEVPGGEGGEGTPSLDDWKLPARYGQTQAAALLRCCERFKIDPFEAFAVKRDHPGLWGILRAYEDIRGREEARAAGGE